MVGVPDGHRTQYLNAFMHETRSYRTVMHIVDTSSLYTYVFVIAHCRLQKFTLWKRHNCAGYINAIFCNESIVYGGD